MRSWIDPWLLLIARWCVRTVAGRSGRAETTRMLGDGIARDIARWRATCLP